MAKKSFKDLFNNHGLRPSVIYMNQQDFEDLKAWGGLTCTDATHAGFDREKSSCDHPDCIIDMVLAE